MSDIHASDYVVLRRAGFTEREISTHMRKFVNLTTIHPCLTFEKRQFDELMADRRALLDALESLCAAADEVSVGSYDEETLDIAVSNARYAITKVKGGRR